MKKPYLSLVIPCYNEEKNLKRGVLNEVENYFKKQKYVSQIILSDDESTDGSREFLEKFAKTHPRFRLLKNKHQGKPFALKTGLKEAKGEIVLFTDMDQSTPINQLAKLLPYFEQNFDIVIGSRGSVRKNAPLLRKVAAKIFLNFRKFFILPEIVDTQCGFKAFRREAIINIFKKMTIFKDIKKAYGWRVTAYDVEVLFLAKKMDYRIKEVPVEWQDEDISVTKQHNFVKESKDMALEILRVKLNDLRGRYGK